MLKTFVSAPRLFLTIALTLSLAPRGLWAVETCAVMPFECSEGAEFQHNLDLMHAGYANLLKQSGRYKLVPSPRSKMEKLGYYKATYTSPLAAAMNAGLLLKTDTVIHGQVTREGNRYTLTTILVNIDQAQTLRSVRSKLEGTVEQLVTFMPESNIALLLNIQTPDPIPARPSKAPVAAAVTKPAPATAKATPPRPVKAPHPPAAPEPSSNDRASTWSRSLSGHWHNVRAWEGWTGGRHRRSPADFNTREYDGFTRYLANHLELGTRMVFFSLKETNGEFLGTIDGLSEEQSAAPTKVFADWMFTRYVGIELTWDKVAARTSTSAEDQHSDGVVTMSGPVVYAFGRYPFLVKTGQRSFIIAPYLGLGMAFFDGNFEDAAWWHLGYPNEAEWLSHGSPSISWGGYRRHIEITDSNGLVIAGGCTFKIMDGLSVDLYLRRIDADVDATFTRSWAHEGSEITQGYFPMSSTGYGLGVRYSF